MYRTNHASLPKSASNGSLADSVSNMSLTSAATAPGGFVGHVLCNSGDTTIRVKIGEVSRKTKRIASVIAAVATFLIFMVAIRSCIPSEVTKWHKQTQQQTYPNNLRILPAPAVVVYHDPPTVLLSSNHTPNVPISNDQSNISIAKHTTQDTPISNQRRRLTHMEFAHKLAPDDLKKNAQEQSGSQNYETAPSHAPGCW